MLPIHLHTMSDVRLAALDRAKLRELKREIDWLRFKHKRFDRILRESMMVDEEIERRERRGRLSED